MAEITRPSIRATGVTTGTVMSLASLSGGYTHRRDKEKYPEVLSPREITERLHEEMAAQSPDLAALVAEYKQKQQRGRRYVVALPCNPDPAAEVAPVPRRGARTATPATGAGQPDPFVDPPRRGGSGLTSSRSGRESEPGTGDQPGQSVPRGERPAGRDTGKRPGRGQDARKPLDGQPRPGQDQGAARTWTLELPAGLPLLSLNGREHWAARHRKAQALKKAAWAVALQAKIPRLERVSVVAEYQPPDLRHRDGDNIAPSAKAAVDGLVVAGILPGDDKRYVTGTYCTIGTLYPKGRLVLTLTEVAATGGEAA